MYKLLSEELIGLPEVDACLLVPFWLSMVVCLNRIFGCQPCGEALFFRGGPDLCDLLRGMYAHATEDLGIVIGGFNTRTNLQVLSTVLPCSSHSPHVADLELLLNPIKKDVARWIGSLGATEGSLILLQVAALKVWAEKINVMELYAPTFKLIAGVVAEWSEGVAEENFAIQCSSARSGWP